METKSEEAIITPEEYTSEKFAGWDKEGGTLWFDDEELASMKSDLRQLEQHICELVDDFEEKHKTIQIKLHTRAMDPLPTYSLAVGGSVQVYYIKLGTCINKPHFSGHVHHVGFAKAAKNGYQQTVD